jgi:hypothetical protein
MVFEKSMEAFSAYNAASGQDVYLHVTKDNRVMLVREPHLASTPGRVTQAIKNALDVLKSHKSPEKHVETLKKFVELRKHKGSMESLQLFAEHEGRSYYLHVTKDNRVLLVREPHLASPKERVAEVAKVLQKTFPQQQKIVQGALVTLQQQKIVDALAKSLDTVSDEQRHALEAMVQFAFKESSTSYAQKVKELLTKLPTVTQRELQQAQDVVLAMMNAPERFRSDMSYRERRAVARGLEEELVEWRRMAPSEVEHVEDQARRMVQFQKMQGQPYNKAIIEYDRDHFSVFDPIEFGKQRFDDSHHMIDYISDEWKPSEVRYLEEPFFNDQEVKKLVKALDTTKVGKVILRPSRPPPRPPSGKPAV